MTIELKVCVAHQMALWKDEWRSFYFTFDQLLNNNVEEVKLIYGIECHYCKRLGELRRR